MLKISEELINSNAPNQNAILNGWGLVRKNSFVKLNISQDETVIFGECVGSGTSNYLTSVDFIKPDSPVFRCTCPSRQFPCKHALGLMYAYSSGKKFTTDTIPADILEKRDKVEKREEKKKEKLAGSASVEDGTPQDGADTSVAGTSTSAVSPKKTNKSALVKKIKAQLEGLELLDKIISSTLQGGLGTINEKSLKILEDQAKQLGNYYIPGAQIALRGLINLFWNSNDREKAYSNAVEQLTVLYALSKKGRDQLAKRLNDPEAAYDPSSTLDEWLGHAWQLSELKEAGLVLKNVDLVQLSFHSYVDNARQEYVDEGIWLNLGSGQLVRTLNYRPFKAAKYIREDDSVYSVVHTEELFVYPGDLNPRIRWESMTMRPLTDNECSAIRSYAGRSFKETVKLVKNQLKNPLSEKDPVALLYYEKISKIGDSYVLVDAEGQRLVLADRTGGLEPETVGIIDLLDPGDMKNQTMLVRFYHDMDAKRLYAKPLSIIRENAVIRLAF
ncbi:MAG TPA: SWIM zinc finger family protein [Clostridia bacterium]|nr:SWIM zinc finger family protein [Clostridia bacterium]